MAPEVIVVGGGIAGLSCAFRLAQNGADVVLVEADSQAGGNVRTEAADGFRFERGPHTFMASAQDVFDLTSEAGLDDELLATRAEADKRFIVRGGRLHAVPTGGWSFLTTRLLSFGGKWKLAGELFRKTRGQPDDTALQFFERRFGPEAARVLAGAFISGVYAGDPAQLSAAAAFPLFWRFEQESGGMIRGARKMMKQRKAERKAKGISKRDARRGLYSFRGGLGRLTATLAERLGDRCRTSSPVQRLSRTQGGFEVALAGEVLTAPRLVLAVPPKEAGRLLGPLDEGLGGDLASIVMAPVAVVHMGHQERAERVPEGFGFLAPRGEGVRSLGVLFPSRLFGDRAPAGGDLFSGFVGGVLDAPALELDDEALLSIVRADLEALLGLDSRPSFLRVARYPGAIPQFTQGHLERMERIHSRVSELAGLHLAGNYLKGVGLKDAVASGFAAATAVGDALEKERAG